MKVLVFAAVVAASSVAQAQYMTGNNLLDYMGSNSPVDRAVASGFVSGVADALDGKVFCVPVGATVGQARDVTRSLLVEFPQQRHEPGYWFVVEALRRAWPCQRSSSKGQHSL